METPWHYLVVQFVVATIGNYKRALKLSIYHRAMLDKFQTDYPSDPDWPMLYSRYDVVHQELDNAYTLWKSAGGTQEGQTLNVDQLLTLLVRRVADWDIQIQGVPNYAKGSPNYKMLMPNGRRSFNTGSKGDRIKAVEVLGGKLINIPPLNTLGGIVQSFHTMLQTANATQESAKGYTKSASAAVEATRVQAMMGQYRNLGFLIDKWYDQTDLIAPMFDLDVLRDSSQVIFTGTLDPAEVEPVLIHTFLSDDELELENKGDLATPAGTMVQFYLAPVAGGTTGTAVNVEVNAGPLSITAAAFGATNYGTHRYLTAVNTNGVELHYVVELL